MKLDIMNKQTLENCLIGTYNPSQDIRNQSEEALKQVWKTTAINDENVQSESR